MPSLALTDAATAAEEQSVRAALRDANTAAGFAHDARPLAVLLHDDAGKVVGGLQGRSAWSWLHIESLAVPADLRGSGLGTRILAMAEEEARMRGCIGARADTYSFQARGFYEKAGFVVSGAIEDCPPGQTRFTMTKRLDVPAAEQWPDAAAPRAAITATEGEWDPLVGVLEDGLTEFNTPFGGHHGFRQINLAVRRPGEARPAGGLVGFVLHRWFFVRLFYLPEDLRRGGLGAMLLRRAEQAALAHGCIGIWLDTFSFQARPFYEKQGYRVFGTIEEHPPGHARHFLMKRLDGAQA
jgi:GNAT superfamily N-acetyltransferase